MFMIPAPISALYQTYQTVKSDEVPKKVYLLIRDLEKTLPNLSLTEQNRMIKRIEGIKSAAKASQVRGQALNTTIETVKYGSSFVAGPAGTTITTYLAHDKQKEIAERKFDVIGKAKKVQGKRVSFRSKKIQPVRTTAIGEAAKVGISDYVTSLIGIGGLAYAGITWAYNKSWNIFGN